MVIPYMREAFVLCTNKASEACIGGRDGSSFVAPSLDSVAIFSPHSLQNFPAGTFLLRYLQVTSLTLLLSDILHLIADNSLIFARDQNYNNKQN